MDDKTLQALTALAHKLGTTAEYLWGVLLKQAPIHGVVGVVAVILGFLLFFWWFSVVKDKTTPKVQESGFKKAEWAGDSSIFAWALWGIVFAGYLMVVVGHAPGIAAAIFNPEYWALMQILGK